MENCSRFFLMKTKIFFPKQKNNDEFYLPFIFRTEKAIEKFVKTEECARYFTQIMQNNSTKTGNFLFTYFFLPMKWKTIPWYIPEIDTLKFPANADVETMVLLEIKTLISKTFGYELEIRS